MAHRAASGAQSLKQEHVHASARVWRPTRAPARTLLHVFHQKRELRACAKLGVGRSARPRSGAKGSSCMSRRGAPACMPNGAQIGVRARDASYCARVLFPSWLELCFVPAEQRLSMSTFAVSGQAADVPAVV
eukprot:471252-Pleurochrysis_carterae.AAC.2